VYGGSGGDSFYRWVMQYGKDQLANTSFPLILAEKPSIVYDYTVTWQHTS
jgi:hypothetical protein